MHALIDVLFIITPCDYSHRYYPRYNIITDILKSKLDCQCNRLLIDAVIYYATYLPCTLFYHYHIVSVTYDCNCINVSTTVITTSLKEVSYKVMCSDTVIAMWWHYQYHTITTETYFLYVYMHSLTLCL